MVQMVKMVILWTGFLSLVPANDRVN